MRWEYGNISLNNEQLGVLETWGHDGWELVAVVPELQLLMGGGVQHYVNDTGDGHLAVINRYIFKRPLVEAGVGQGSLHDSYAEPGER